MEKSKVFLLIKTLTDSEIEQLGTFVRSPYFNDKAELVRLFDLMLQQSRTNNRTWDRNLIFQQVFPGEPYHEKKLNYASSDLNKLIEQFLVIQTLKEPSVDYHLQLLEELMERNLSKSYQQTNRVLQQELESAPILNGQQKFQAQYRWWAIQERNFENQRLRRFDPSIQHASEWLDRFYFLQRLNYSCAMLDRGTILQAPYEVGLTESWVEHLTKQAFFNEPIIELYYLIYQALKNEEEEPYFDQLQRHLQTISASENSKDLKDIYLFAINYCARKIRKGKTRFVSEALTLYLQGIERKILIQNEELSPWTFTNVVKLALRLQRFEWIKQFIHQYAPALPESFRTNALHYNMAEVHYYTGQYEEAQDHLRQVVYSDLNYYLGARVLMAKIFYEQDEMEPLLSLIASFTIFLKRNKEISDNLKSTFLNFCNLLFQIVRWSPRQVAGLKQKLEDTDPLSDRAWLLKIYEEKQGF